MQAGSRGDRRTDGLSEAATTTSRRGRHVVAQTGGLRLGLRLNRFGSNRTTDEKTFELQSEFLELDGGVCGRAQRYTLLDALVCVCGRGVGNRDTGGDLRVRRYKIEGRRVNHVIDL